MTREDLLPARSSYCRGAGFYWDATLRVLETTTGKKCSCRYAVAELPVPKAEGRCFRLTKLDAGTDPEGDAYTVVLARVDSCDCRGFLRHGHCKHLDAVRSILTNGWWPRGQPRPLAELVDAAAETWPGSGLWFEDETPTED